jgi:hypothetical protein
MTSNEIARREEDSWVEILGPVGDLSTKIARTEFVPRGIQGNVAAVAAAILTGREMGLGPMTSLRGIHIVEGRPSLTAEMLAARILAAGHRIEWKESNDDRATVRVERADGLSEAEVTWTMKDATRAGLAGKKVWQQYGRRMLQHRALTEAASMACPDVSLGLDVETVAEDGRPASSTTVTVHRIDPTPEPASGPPEPVEDHPEPVVIEAEVIAEPPPPPGVTKPQMRKIGALIGEVEKISGEKLDRDQRRNLIANMAGVDPGALESANNLTEQQASTAIDALTQLVSDALAADEPAPAVRHSIEEHP